jgi:5-methylthioribose kinase
MSVLLRSKLEIETAKGERRSLTYIVKCLLTSVFNKEMVSGYGAFPKEKEMFSLFLPEFEKLFADAGVSMSFGPKCFYSAEEPAQIIVMEDLSNYEMLQRSVGLDQNHTEKGLAWLAKFHAASMVYREKNGDYGDEFKSGVFSISMEPTYQSYYDGYFDYYIEALRKLPEGEKYAEKALKWRGVLYESICKSLEYDPSAFNVLNHGDMWSNNLMFLYNENREIEDLKLVDYQLPFWGSVAKDIYNFMMSSWCIDIRVQKFEELIKLYFDNLIENLKLLKYRKALPTFQDLKNELLRRNFVGENF